MGSARSTYTITGLRNNLQQSQTYDVRIRAVNSEGAGEATVFRANRPGRMASPGYPRNVTGRADGEGGIVVDWDPPAASGSEPIVDYEYRVRERRPGRINQHVAQGGGSEHGWVSIGSTGTRFTITRIGGEWLKDGGTYIVGLRSVNDIHPGHSTTRRSYISKQVEVTVSGTAPGYSEPEASPEFLPQVVDDTDAAPAIESVTVLDPPGADGSWDAGDTLEIEVAFDVPAHVDTSGGTPSISLLLGTATVSAPYAGGSTTTTLTFAYDLPAGAASANTVLITANAIALNGGTITSAGGLAADLTHNAVGFAAPPPPAGLTASVESAPAQHDGSSAFTVPDPVLRDAQERRAREQGRPGYQRHQHRLRADRRGRRDLGDHGHARGRRRRDPRARRQRNV